MITETFAQQFAHEWIAAWNSHDIDAVMAHYANDINFTSPIIVQMNNDPLGTITDKAALKDYFTRALQRFPDLSFTLEKVLLSVNSVVLYYTSVNNSMSAECMEFNGDGKVIRVVAHYATK